MTAHEYIDRCQGYRRNSNFMAFFFGAAWVAAFALGHWADKSNSSVALPVVVAAAGAIGFVMFYTVMRAPVKKARGLGLICTKCNCRLVGNAGQPLVLKGNCPNCGTQVLD